MARVWTNINGQHLGSPGYALVTAVPLSMFIMVKPFSDASGLDYYFTIGDTATQNQYFALGAFNSLFRGRKRSSAEGNATVNAGSTYILGRWYRMLLVWEAVALTKLYVDGIHVATTTTSVTPDAGTFDDIHIGGRVGKNDNTPDAHLAEACIWNVALNSAEARDLNTVNPNQVRSGNIRGHWSCDSPGAVVLDKSGYGNHMTDNNNNISIAGHPLLLSDELPVFAKVAAAASGAFLPYHPIAPFRHGLTR